MKLLSNLLRRFIRRGALQVYDAGDRLHDYDTLQDWRAKFMENWDKAVAIYDERFCRMWKFYLISSELAILNGSQMIFRLVLANKRDAVPRLRDYMIDDERALASRVLGALRVSPETGRSPAVQHILEIRNCAY